MRWRPVERSEGQYEVSDTGHLRSTKLKKPSMRSLFRAELSDGRVAFMRRDLEVCRAWHRTPQRGCGGCYPELQKDHRWRSKDRKQAHTVDRLKAAHQRFMGKGTSL